MLVSNMALLREAGFDAPPTSWEELREIAQAVTTRDSQGRISTSGFAFAQSSTGAGLVHPYYALMYSSGSDIYADDHSTANLDTPASVEVTTRMAGLVQDGITDLSIDAYDFPAGGIGMMIMANWLKSEIRDGLGDGFEDVTVSPIPAGDDWKTLQYAFFMGVDSSSSRAEAAWDLVRYLNEPRDGQPSCVAQMLEGMGALTASVADTAALPAPDDFTAPYVAALAEDRAISQPNVMQAAEIERMVARALELVIGGTAEPQAALSALNGEVEDILFEFY